MVSRLIKWEYIISLLQSSIKLLYEWKLHAIIQQNGSMQIQLPWIELWGPLRHALVTPSYKTTLTISNKQEGKKTIKNVLKKYGYHDIIAKVTVLLPSGPSVVAIEKNTIPILTYNFQVFLAVALTNRPAFPHVFCHWPSSGCNATCWH